MIVRRAVLCSTLLAFALGGGAVTALAAKPTPVPGGANQLAGVSGTLSQTLFNGTLRLRKMSLTDPVPSDNIRSKPGERSLVFHAVVSNGTHHEDHGYFNATLADADGITITGRPLDDGWSLEPGAAARAVNGFSVPLGFVPTKLLLEEAAHPKSPAFRITLKPSDIPAAPPASPAP